MKFDLCLSRVRYREWDSKHINRILPIVSAWKNIYGQIEAIERILSLQYHHRCDIASTKKYLGEMSITVIFVYVWSFRTCESLDIDDMCVYGVVCSVCC